MTLAEMVQAELQRTGRTQRSVTLEVGLSPQTIANVIHGSRPDFMTLCRLSRFLQEPLAVLLQVSGLAPWLDIEQEQVLQPMVDDWPTLEIVRIVRRLTREQRKRILRLLQLWLDDQRGDASLSVIGGDRAMADEGPFVLGGS